MSWESRLKDRLGKFFLLDSLIARGIFSQYEIEHTFERQRKVKFISVGSISGVITKHPEITYLVSTDNHSETKVILHAYNEKRFWGRNVTYDAKEGKVFALITVKRGWRSKTYRIGYNTSAPIGTGFLVDVETIQSNVHTHDWSFVPVGGGYEDAIHIGSDEFEQKFNMLLKI